MLPNSAEMIFAWFACSLLRLVNVPLNPALRAGMLERPFVDSRARGLVIHREFVPAMSMLSAEVRATLNSRQQRLLERESSQHEEGCWNGYG